MDENKAKLMDESNSGQTTKNLSELGFKTVKDRIFFFDEAGRENLYKWKEKADKRKVFYIKHFSVYFIEWRIWLNYFFGFNYMVILNMLLTAVCAYLCNLYDVKFGYLGLIISTPIAFSLAFLINNDFRRLDTALFCLADFKSNLFYFMLLCRDLKMLLRENQKSTLLIMMNKLIQLTSHVREFLLTIDDKKRSSILLIIYEDFSDISQLIEKYSIIDMNGNMSLINRMHLYSERTVLAFERLRNIRDYRVPYMIRSYSKILTFIVPLVLTPMFNFYSTFVEKSRHWAPIMFAIIFSYIYSYMQSLQDRLYDPFLGFNKDEINLDSLIEWIDDSIKKALNRNYKVGRFQVNQGTDEKDAANLTEEEQVVARIQVNKDQASPDTNEVSPLFKLKDGHVYFF